MSIGRLLDLQHLMAQQANAMRILTHHAIRGLQSDQTSATDAKIASIHSQAMWTGGTAVLAGLFSVVAATSTAHSLSLPEKDDLHKWFKDVVPLYANAISGIVDRALGGTMTAWRKADEYAQDQLRQIAERRTQELDGLFRGMDDLMRSLDSTVQATVGASHIRTNA